MTSLRARGTAAALTSVAFAAAPILVHHFQASLGHSVWVVAVSSKRPSCRPVSARLKPKRMAAPLKMANSAVEQESFGALHQMLAGRRRRRQLDPEEVRRSPALHDGLGRGPPP